MTTKTKTDKLPTVEQATGELDKAKAELEAARNAVISGDTTVSPSDIAQARDAVEYAELRVELAADADTHRAEKARTERIAELVASLTTGDVAAKGRNVVDLEAKAVAALGALYRAAVDYHGATTAAKHELARLGPPEDVAVSGGGSILLHGQRIPANTAAWPGNVLRGAVHTALSPHLPQLTATARDLYNNAGNALAGGIHDEKRTPAQMLAEALDRLAATNG